MENGGWSKWWYDEECKLATGAKNEAGIKAIQRTTRANNKSNIERKLFWKKKSDSEKQVFVQINSLGNNKDTWKLYQKIKDVVNGYHQQPLLCKDANG